MITLHDAIAGARRRLERAGIDPAEAAVDAELLARTLLGWDRAHLIASFLLPCPDGFPDPYNALVSRRERREPVAYIVGFREFWRRDFIVGPDVLVPRPETESIVEEALSRFRAHSAVVGSRALDIADVGTGTGCLAVTLALELPRPHVVATDTSRAALGVAEQNARRHEANESISFAETDLLSDVEGRFDLVVSNPPYVPSASLPALPPEVRDYEPVEALDGGEDGLNVIRRLLIECETRLREGALLVFEFGFGQESGVCDAVASRPAFHLDAIRNDLQGIPRTAVVRFSSRQ